MAKDTLIALPRFARGFALTTTGGARPISGFAKLKRRLDDAIAERRERDGREANAAVGAARHQAHRADAARQRPRRGGVRRRARDRPLAAGLHGVYDQGTHRDAKRAALNRWADALAIIVGAEPAPERRQGGERGRGRDAAPRQEASVSGASDENRARRADGQRYVAARAERALRRRLGAIGGSCAERSDAALSDNEKEMFSSAVKDLRAYAGPLIAMLKELPARDLLGPVFSAVRIVGWFSGPKEIGRPLLRASEPRRSRNRPRSAGLAGRCP